jgi:hypothetical protein
MSSNGGEIYDLATTVVLLLPSTPVSLASFAAAIDFQAASPGFAVE